MIGTTEAEETNSRHKMQMEGASLDRQGQDSIEVGKRKDPARADEMRREGVMCLSMSLLLRIDALAGVCRLAPALFPGCMPLRFSVHARNCCR